ncbi:MAG: hypothetical protein JWR27_224 [Aeromicrobium sp.]|nr:hypothetical protein [Aeromicrobium sp.]
MEAIAAIGWDDGTWYVVGVDGTRVAYTPRAVTLPDGTTLAHESRGGTLASVAAVEHDPFFLEIAYLGDGPTGGELVMTATGPASHTVMIGDLWTGEPLPSVPPSWPVAVDMALGLTTADTQIIAADQVISRDELEAFHQRLLGALHG